MLWHAIQKTELLKSSKANNQLLNVYRTIPRKKQERDLELWDFKSTLWLRVSQLFLSINRTSSELHL